MARQTELFAAPRSRGWSLPGSGADSLPVTILTAPTNVPLPARLRKPSCRRRGLFRHAALGTAAFGQDDQLRQPRLGVRPRRRLPVSGSASGHRGGLAADPSAGAEHMAGAGLLSAPAGGLPRSISMIVRRGWASTRTVTKRNLRRPWSRSRSETVAASVTAACGAAIRRGKLELNSGDVLVMGGAARLTFHGVDKIFPGSSGLLPDGGRINLTLRRVTRPRDM